jgi:predicted phosphodiesterase
MSQMRIAVLSDIHGNLAALEAVLADVKDRGADVIVNLGDLVSGPLQPRETAERLMELSLPTISGNHERQLLTQSIDRMGPSDRFAREQLSDGQMRWLQDLPDSLHLPEGALLVHGTPRSDLEYFLETVDADGVRSATPGEVLARAAGANSGLILCGHTHIQRVFRCDDGRIVVNPGSIGLPAYAADQPIPHRMESGSPTARYAIVEQERGAWSASTIEVNYDWNSAARLAAARGRPDWAAALATGRL